MKKVLDVVLLFTIAFIFIRFIMTPTRTPTGSMIPTIEPNNYIIINRIPYYYRDPKAGEVVTFYHEKKRLMKRVIARPGDILDIKDGKVYVNNEELEEEYLYRQDTTASFMMPQNSLPLEIPEDRYFVMGDNRERSEDSRDFGLIHRRAIYAKTWLRVWPLNKVTIVK